MEGQKEKCGQWSGKSCKVNDIVEKGTEEAMLKSSEYCSVPMF